MSIDHILGLSKFRATWHHQLLSLGLHGALMPAPAIILYYTVGLSHWSALLLAALVSIGWETVQSGIDDTPHPNLLDRARDILHSPLGASLAIGWWPVAIVLGPVVVAIWTAGIVLSRVGEDWGEED